MKKKDLKVLRESEKKWRQVKKIEQSENKEFLKKQSKETREVLIQEKFPW